MIKPGSEVEKERLTSVLGRYIPYTELCKGVMKCSRALVALCVEDMLINGHVSATTTQIQTHLTTMREWPEWEFIDKLRTKGRKRTAYSYGSQDISSIIYKITAYSDRAIRHIEHQGCTRIKKTGPNGGGHVVWDLTTFKGVL